jgi:hypothetical protein
MTDSAKALTHQPLNSEPAALADSDYDSILGAVMETARGRWFLHEYVRRNRNADTGTLLAAIDRIESMLKARDRDGADENAPAPADVTGIVARLRDLAENLIECGAPTYLCNELVRRIEELNVAISRRADEAVAAEAEPIAVTQLEIVVSEELRDPFADILALSPEERIALFT